MPVGERIDDPRLSQAERRFSEALAQYGHGVLLEEEQPRNLSGAAGAFADALALDPDASVERYLDAAELAFRSGQRAEAIGVLRGACQRYPRSYDARMRLAAYAQIVDEHDLVIAVANEAIKLRPELPVAYARRAYAWLQKDAPQKSLRSIRDGLKAAEAPGLLLDTLPLVASVYKAKDDYQSALRCYELVLEHRPGQFQAREQIVRCLVEGGAPAKARKALDALAADRATQPPHYSLTLAVLYEGLGALDQAVAYYKQACADNPDAPTPHFRLASVYLQMQENKKAIPLLERVAAQRPGNEHLLLLLADIYDRIDHTDKAVEYLERACDVSSDSSPYVRLALLQLRLDAPDQAIIALKDAIRVFPTDPTPYTTLGWVYSFSSKYEKALEAFESTARIATDLELAPEDLHPMFHFWLGSAHERLGHHEAAAEAFLTCIRLYPEHDQCLNYLAYMWSEQGVRLDEALALVDRALAIDPDSAAYIDTRGWILYQQGRYRKALKELQRAHALLPDDPVVTEHVGDAYAALKKTESAIDWWTRSLRLDPQSKAVQDKLSDAGADLEALLKAIHEAEAGSKPESRATPPVEPASAD